MSIQQSVNTAIGTLGAVAGISKALKLENEKVNQANKSLEIRRIQAEQDKEAISTEYKKFSNRMETNIYTDKSLSPEQKNELQGEFEANKAQYEANKENHEQLYTAPTVEKYLTMKKDMAAEKLEQAKKAGKSSKSIQAYERGYEQTLDALYSAKSYRFDYDEAVKTLQQLVGGKK